MKTIVKIASTTSLCIFTVFAVTAIKPAEATTDGYCQYPGRWTNPVGGCDNTDPANPECIEEMYSQKAEQDCINGKTQAKKTKTIKEQTKVVEIKKPKKTACWE